jgi:hypothetical protein
MKKKKKKEWRNETSIWAVTEWFWLKGKKMRLRWAKKTDFD